MNEVIFKGVESVPYNGHWFKSHCYILGHGLLSHCPRPSNCDGLRHVHVVGGGGCPLHYFAANIFLNAFIKKKTKQDGAATFFFFLLFMFFRMSLAAPTPLSKTKCYVPGTGFPSKCVGGGVNYSHLLSILYRDKMFRSFIH